MYIFRVSVFLFWFAAHLKLLFRRKTFSFTIWLHLIFILFRVLHSKWLLTPYFFKCTCWSRTFVFNLFCFTLYIVKHWLYKNHITKSIHKSFLSSKATAVILCSGSLLRQRVIIYFILASHWSIICGVYYFYTMCFIAWN